ncbi:efflux RND transporter permease subunit [Lichenicola sp.]|uniref:efflux RND transporter permease subunit n=1 Tax=Lichenicola sp. TaxID=2804529 RepID=UPI003B0009BB
MSVRPMPSADALTVARGIEAQIGSLRRQLPPSLHIIAVEDMGDFIRASIHEVVVTLVESLAIVALVVFAFLGSWRSVLVPLVTIPLSLTGTFAMMSLMGFSINLLTLLALVLAIGLVVDDAIIVVENVNRHLARGLAPIAAATEAAAELVQPILAMTLVLVAVYVPLGLQGGLTGALFIEFAFTLAGAVTISALLALTLSPMMSSRLLRARAAPGRRTPLSNRMQRRSERALDGLQRGYIAGLRATLKLQPLVLLAGLAVLGSSWFFYTHARHELSPAEDTGEIDLSGNGAPDATSDALERYNPSIIAIYKSVPEMIHFYVVDEAPSVEGGLDLSDWSHRRRSIFTIGDEVQAKLSRIAGLDMASYVPPYLPGSDGLPIGFVLQSTGDFEQLDQESTAFLDKVRASGLFSYADKDLKIDQPQATIVVDRAKLAALKLTMNDLGISLNAMLGESYTGFFSANRRSYKVEPMAMRRFRLNPDQILDYPIRSANGIAVPLRSVAHIENSVVPESISHFQQLQSATISALPAPGITQGQAYDDLQHLAGGMLPAGYSTDTVGPLRQFVQETGGFTATFTLALVITYLALAALFESFRDSLIILVSVPMSMAGALLFVWLGIGGASINLFTQVGLVTLMGLISKHGILIVEVAKESQAMGLDKQEAILRACTLRLRPILMTTAAMVLGVMPLVLATGAGAASRFVMGLVIASGLSIGTLFTLFVLPAVYVLLASRRQATPVSSLSALAAR